MAHKLKCSESFFFPLSILRHQAKHEMLKTVQTHPSLFPLCLSSSRKRQSRCQQCPCHSPPSGNTPSRTTDLMAGQWHQGEHIDTVTEGQPRLCCPVFQLLNRETRVGVRCHALSHPSPPLSTSRLYLCERDSARRNKELRDHSTPTHRRAGAQRATQLSTGRSPPYSTPAPLLAAEPLLRREKSWSLQSQVASLMVLGVHISPSFFLSRVLYLPMKGFFLTTLELVAMPPLLHCFCAHGVTFPSFPGSVLQMSRGSSDGCVTAVRVVSELGFGASGTGGWPWAGVKR